MRRVDTTSESRVPVVGGYTLTEVLSVGERANVFAAVAGAEPPGSSGAPSVVVKVRLGGPGTSVRHARFATASHLAELDVLSARPIAAMPRLLEVVGDEEGRPALVLMRCVGRPLREALRAFGDRDDSVVRAIGAAVRQLHEAGWAHGGLDPGSVLVGADAAVTLVGFGRAVARGAPGFDDAVGRDVAWVSRLARARSQDRSQDRDRDRPVVERGAAAVAVAVADDLEGVAPADAPPADAELAPELEAEWAWPDERARAPEGTGDAPRIAETVDPALAAVGELLRAVRAAPGGWARRLPRRVVTKVGLAAVLVVVVVTAVVVLLPGGERAEGGNRGGGGVESGAVAQDGAEGDGGAEGDDGAAGAAEREGAADAPVEDTAPTSGADSAVSGDDPVAATAALLRARAECFAAGDAACLDGVDQWGSPALAADLEEMQGDSGEQRMLPVEPEVEVLRLVQRVGDFALVEVTGEEAAVVDGAGTAAAPLLVVRGGAGWRLRSYGPVGP